MAFHNIDPDFGDCRVCGATREQLDDNFFPQCPEKFGGSPTVFDIAQWGRRVATQADFDRLMATVRDFEKFAMTSLAPSATEWSPNVELACYVNPMRQDGVFVAEKREIKPYPGHTHVDGSPCYPSVPQGGVRFPMQLDHEFARRVVACWNACRLLTTEDLENGPPVIRERGFGT